jgi:hypothetical protein
MRGSAREFVECLRNFVASIEATDAMNVRQDSPLH